MWWLQHSRELPPDARAIETQQSRANVVRIVRDILRWNVDLGQGEAQGASSEDGWWLARTGEQAPVCPHGGAGPASRQRRGEKPARTYTAQSACTVYNWILPLGTRLFSEAGTDQVNALTAFNRHRGKATSSHDL
jgi:hypothetical protein